MAKKEPGDLTSTTSTTPTVAASTPPPTGLADNITSQDLRLPRVALLQALSPLVQNEGDKYKQGTFIDTLTQEVLPTPLSFVPVFVFANVIKWKPRSEGGGMLWKTINPTAEQLKETQFDGAKRPTADRYINAVCLIAGQSTPLIVSFCKTSLKAGQDLATLIQLSGCAWKFNYILEAIKTKNDKGTYYVMRVRRDGPTDATRAQEAADLYEQVKGMSIETDYEGGVAAEPTNDTEPREF